MCILFGKIFQHFWIFLCINLTNPTLVYLLTFGGNAPFLGHNKSFIIVPWAYLRMLGILFSKTVWIWKQTLKANFLSFEHCSILSGWHHVSDMVVSDLCSKAHFLKQKWTMCWKTREHLNGLGKTGGCRGCICCHQETFLFVLPQIHRK